MRRIGNLYLVETEEERILQIYGAKGSSGGGGFVDPNADYYVSATASGGGVGTIDDINKSFTLGYGWPKGIFDFVPEYGIDNIVSVLKAKEEKASDWSRDFYKADPLLTKWAS